MALILWYTIVTLVGGGVVVVNNPYKILGVSPSLSKNEIKKKYRDLSKRFHPDSPTGDSQMFMEVTKAWEQINKYHLDSKRGIWQHDNSLFRIRKGG